MLEFAWPWLLLLLPLPILVWWLLPPYRARQASVQVPFFDRLAAATGQTPQRGAVILERRAVQMTAAVVIWILLVVALAGPQWVGDAVTREVSARDLILAIDISGSMDQRDFKAPDGTTLTRLDGVKRVVKDFIARRRGAIVQAALDAREEKRRKQEKDDSAPPDEKADEMRVDPKQKGGKKITVSPEDVTTPGAAEAWMRQVQTSPADFLKLKFAIQAAAPTPGRTSQ